MPNGRKPQVAPQATHGKVGWICYLDEYPDVVNDQEVHPEFVRREGLQLIYYGEQFADVIDSVLDQRPDATVDEFVDALSHYMKRDTFMDFDWQSVGGHRGRLRE